MSANGIAHLTTRQDRQDAKLAIAEAKRQGKVVAPDGTITGSVDPTAPWYRDNNVLDKNLLPNPYNGNDIDPDDGATTLTNGRPWTE
jgi:hypothetical protein